MKILTLKLTILEIFQHFFTDEVLEELSKESNEYFCNKLKSKYREDYKNYPYTNQSLPFLYFKYGINKKQIMFYIGIRIFMGIVKLPSIDSY